MTETGHNRFTAVDSRHFMVFRISAEFEGFFDNRREIFIVINVYEFGIRNYFCSENTVRICRANRHETVCRKEKSAGNVSKFFLLILPGRPEVTFEVFVFFEFRIPVSRQHFTVCVNSNARTFSLF